MADLEWLPTEDGTHAVVLGDLLTLCGDLVDRRPTMPVPGTNVCPKCRELIVAMAAALVEPTCDCGHLIESHCVVLDSDTCLSGGGCHACGCERLQESWSIEEVRRG